mgnify:CR=1 FL=1
MRIDTDSYDWQDDHRKNIEFAYAFIRERVDKGGKGWRGYAMWRSVVSAPSDTEVLVYGSGYYVAYFNSLTKEWYSMGEELAFSPVYWQPLPEPTSFEKTS